MSIAGRKALHIQHWQSRHHNHPPPIRVWARVRARVGARVKVKVKVRVRGSDLLMMVGLEEAISS